MEIYLQVVAELFELAGTIADTDDVRSGGELVASLETTVANCEAAASQAEQEADRAREREQEIRAPVADAQAEINRIDTESRTLTRILNASGSDLFPAVLENVRAQAGYEKALGAALGEDLDVPLDPSAPAHWAQVSQKGDAAMPEGVSSLASFVSAPQQLSRRLAQIGVVTLEQGNSLVDKLMPGQRLVTVDGDLWRWDGYRASAEAPTAAAQKLEQKNRLAELDRAAIEATKQLRLAEAAFEEARADAVIAREGERTAREDLRQSQNRLGEARKSLSEAERSIQDISNRRSALEEARARLKTDLDEVAAELADAEAANKSLPDLDQLTGEAQAAGHTTSEQRAVLAQIRAKHESLSRESEMRLQRLAAIGRERQTWNERAVNADRQIKTLRERLEKTNAEIREVEQAPDHILTRRRALETQIEEAEKRRKQAADILAETENDQRKSDRIAAEALEALSEAKQVSARAEERVASARQRRQEVEDRIREELECEPHLAFQQTGLDSEAKLPEADGVERKLERLKSERERLGAVNLRAEEEQNEVMTQRDNLVGERDDLLEAIRQLRNGIQSLNKEGRERLLKAFDEVNAQFQKLFTHLFGGGTAELQLVESDDPLEAGLEILARPPGKKPQTMTLLSGGEQALTAMALIFAVFLTNPAPICVLDEVDAPLDDHNVERFCNLMDQMSAETDTRFVIITHNPITMARMNRLFGVTMAERGVSQLVSVDLQTAEAYRDAG